MTALDLPNHEPKDPQVTEIQTDLSKYTLQDDSHLQSGPTGYSHADSDPIFSSVKYPMNQESNDSSVYSLSTTPDSVQIQFSDTSKQQQRIQGDQFNQFDMNNGIIHGHVHNFQNFTYIHGHIHTNDSSFPDDVYQEAQVTDELPSKNSHLRSSSHSHQNDFHSQQFLDCHHFEFLNCHDRDDSKIIEDQSLRCDVDENCKPKIVEICCENNHVEGVPFISNLPSCVDIQPETSKLVSDSIPFENCNFDDCVDLECDLDTCDIDELYCKICEDVDKVEEQEEEKSLGQAINLKTQAKDSVPSAKSTVALNDILPYEQQTHHHHHHKRHRDDEDHQAHHLHRHRSHQSEKHHHHHIQLHDHVQKKARQTNDTINFEWNFRNQQTKCEWENCGTTADNSFQLQNHIFDNHLLNEYPTVKDQQQIRGSFECEWRNCDFIGDDLFGLVYHINSKHSLRGQDDKHVQSLIQQHDSMWAKTEEIPTPRSDSNSNTPKSPVKKKYADEQEETTCKWLHVNEDGSTIECNQHFSNGQELTDHLINEHVGSGKSEYTCLWSGCDRNSRGFNQRQKVIRHLHVHTRYKPFVCSICNHSFAVESMLEQHMRTHSGEKPYICKTCGKNFATSSSLSIHMRTHTGEKPLVCKYPGCGKRFSESSNLTKHMKTHEKLFKCDCCSKSFSKEKQLASHKSKYHT